LFLVLGLSARPASAQWGGIVTLSSQATLRGRPISDHRPVAELELVHDDPAGFYIGGSAAVVARRHSGLQLFAFGQYAGFARRLRQDTVVDIGIVHSGYTGYSSIRGGGSYTEVYAGILSRHLAGRIFLSPGYFRKDAPTVYVEAEGNADLSGKASLYAHAGVLMHLRDSSAGAETAFDWRMGIKRRFGAVSLDAAWTGYAAQRGEYDAQSSSNALILDLALVF